MATVSASHFCAECNKTFKNLRLHIVKAHENIVVNMNLGWSAANDENDWDMPTVKYNGRACEATDGWGSDSLFTQLYEFPQEIIDQNKDEYFGLEVTFTVDTGRVHSVAYARRIKNWEMASADCETFRPIARSRIVEIIEHV
jgi:hypothetical protein